MRVVVGSIQGTLGPGSVMYCRDQGLQHQLSNESIQVRGVQLSISPIPIQVRQWVLCPSPPLDSLPMADSNSQHFVTQLSGLIGTSSETSGWSANLVIA